MRTFRPSRWMTAGCLAAAATLTLGACAKKSSSSATTKSPPGVLVNEALVPGIGTVVVNAGGKTYYALSSEANGTITCTDASGCTAVWPDTELPSGVKAATAGPGVDGSKLGTVKDSAGHSYVTFGGYPLYTYSKDPSPGVATGQGIQSFGGTWEVMNVSGTVIAPAGGTAPNPSPSPSSAAPVVPAPVHTTAPATVPSHTTAPAPTTAAPKTAPPSPQPTYNNGY